MWLNGPQLPSATQARLGTIPNGEPGAVSTMKAMRQLVRDAVRDPKQRVRETALGIIGNAGYVEQARRCQQWVQGNIRYVRDPPDVELVQTPQYTLQQRAGDCDDQSVLLASMLMATGHPAQFIAVGLQQQPLSHVMVQTLIGQNWAGVETILPKGLGWMPDGITSYHILKV